MSEPEDGGWSSNNSLDMDVDEYSDTISVELEAEEEEMILNQSVVRPAIRSSARLSARVSAQASGQSTSRAPVSPTRSPIRSTRQRAHEMNLATVSHDSEDSTDLVTYEVIDPSGLEMIPILSVNVPRVEGHTGIHSDAPSGSFQDLQRLNQSYLGRRVGPIDNAQQPITSKKPSENAMTDSCNIEASSCPICLEDLTNAGSHRPACLKCGHIFGESCIQRWIKVGCNCDARRCPTCNTKASLKDIRVLYTNKLIAVDTAELLSVQVALKQQQILNGAMNAALINFRVKHNNLKDELKKLKVVIDTLETHAQPPGAGPTSARDIIKRIKINGTNPDCRVMAYSKNNMLLVVSQAGEGPFVNSHGIRKLNASVLEPTKECILPHKKQIRDMCFHPIDHNQLATVSLDKSVCLIDLSSNSVVSNVGVDEPLWCCCWAGNNTNILVAGGQMGSLYLFDRRYMKLLEQLSNRNPACVSLSSIPPATCRSYPNGGFLKTRMDCLSIFEEDTAQSHLSYKEYIIPIKGKWSSTTYDIKSNFLLTSAKPCGVNRTIRHIVSQISNSEEDAHKIQPIVLFYGGDKATQLTRSCLVPFNDNDKDVLMCGFDEKSKAIKIFNVNTNKHVHNFPVNEMFTDICALDGIIMNGRRTIAALSNCAVSIFSV